MSWGPIRCCHSHNVYFMMLGMWCIPECFYLSPFWYFLNCGFGDDTTYCSVLFCLGLRRMQHLGQKDVSKNYLPRWKWTLKEVGGILYIQFVNKTKAMLLCIHDLHTKYRMLITEREILSFQHYPILVSNLESGIHPESLISHSWNHLNTRYPSKQSSNTEQLRQNKLSIARKQSHWKRVCKICKHRHTVVNSTVTHMPKYKQRSLFGKESVFVYN
jgi:hypothetical protein